MDPDPLSPPPAAAAPPATPPGQADPEAEAAHRRRNGFVARKPKEVRDKIDLMLDDGVPYRQVAEALGDDGKDLNEDHIGSWARGGHQEWLASLERADALRSTHDSAIDLLKQKAGEPAQDAARTVAAAQLYELLLSFNPTAFAAALSAKPELYLGLVNALSRLSEADAACLHRRAQQSAVASKLASGETTSDKKLLTDGELKDLTREIKLI